MPEVNDGETIFGVCLTALVWLVAIPAQAHHSFGAEFDANKPITLKGVVRKVEWTNPHSHFSLEVKDEKGRIATWVLTGYTVNALYRTGWKKDVTMKVGDTVSIFGWRAQRRQQLRARTRGDLRGRQEAVLRTSGWHR